MRVPVKKILLSLCALGVALNTFGTYANSDYVSTRYGKVKWCMLSSSGSYSPLDTGGDGVTISKVVWPSAYPKGIPVVSIPKSLGWPSGGSQLGVIVTIVAVKSSVFSNATGIQTLNIPQPGIKTIQVPFCKGCSNLTKFQINDSDVMPKYAQSSYKYGIENGVLYIKEQGGTTYYTKNLVTVVKYPEGKAGTTYSVPSTVTKLESYCFANTKLQTLKFAGPAPKAESTAFSGSSLVCLYPQGASGWTGTLAGAPTYAIPNAVANVSASQGDFQNRVTISWTANAVAKSYVVYRSTSATGSKTTLATLGSGSTIYTDYNAAANTKYYYWVKAVNGPAESALSASAQGWVNVPDVVVTFIPNATDATVSPTSKAFSPGKTYGSLPTPTRTGYNFDGWYTAATGGTKITASSTVTSSRTTLYAHWIGKTYSVTLNRQTGTGGSSSVTATYGSAMPAITKPNRTGYAFGGYWSDSACSQIQYYTASGASARNWDRTASATLYAKWTLIIHNVTLAAQGGSGGTTSITATPGFTMPGIEVPIWDDHAFRGYWSQPNGEGRQYYSSSGAPLCEWDGNGNATLYAFWVALADIKTITFNANGGTCPTASDTYILGNTYGHLPTATRTGYSFIGWFTAMTGGVKIDTSSTVTATRTVYAQWSAKTCAITLAKQKGTGGTESVRATYDQVPPDISVPTRTGYTFRGYAETSTGGGVRWYDASGHGTRIWNSFDATKTLYADWQANTYRISFVGGEEAQGTMQPFSHVFDSGIPLPTCAFIQPGCRFMGWADSPDGEAILGDGDVPTFAEDKTLYALWEKIVWHVDAATGNDAATGYEWSTAKKTIQAAIDSAIDNDVILVNDGVYEPISTVSDEYRDGKWVLLSKTVSIVSVNGAEKTIIDGSLTWSRNVTNRCAQLGLSMSGSTLEGFTLRKGRPTGGISPIGAGAYGGTLRRCIITDNDSGNASGGGAAYAILECCQIIGNRSCFNGGGAFACDLVDCVIENNVAEENGGGTSAGRLERCIIKNNTAKYGGGHQGGDAEDCLIKGNSATLGGGGVAGANLSRCTVVNNHTDGVGGGAIGAVLHSSIIWDNTAGEQDDNCNTSQGFYNDTVPRLPGTGNISANPMFKDVSSGDYSLTLSSPCIDAGFGPTRILREDLAGEQRWQGIRIDMGAYEFANSFTPMFVTGDLWVDARNGSDAKSGAARDEALATIGAAIEKAVDGVTIHVLPGTYDPFTLDGRTLTVQSTDGAEKTIVNGAGMSRCAWLGADSESVVEGFTLCNGYTPMDGGGVWGGTLRKCIIRDNTAGNFGGGAVLARLDHCVIKGNTAPEGSGGGAFYCDLSNCLVFRNSAVHGGGVWSGGHFVANCTIADNTASTTGGGIISAGYVTNSIVWGNSAPSYPNIYGCDEWRLCSPVVDPGRGSITSDPMFVDAANGDYRLRIGSPCIDAGINAGVGNTDTDLAGNPRKLGPAVDIGAYECAALSPVYRFYSPRTKGHFFTMNETEKNNLIATAAHIWNFEGVAYYAYRTQVPGTVPLYRFYSPGAKGHFYTRNEGEKNGLIANSSRIWNFEGVAYYVAASQVAGTTPVYRFWAPGAKHHFYTRNEGEKNSLVANASRIWNFEGIAFFAWPNAGAARGREAKGGEEAEGAERVEGVVRPSSKSTRAPGRQRPPTGDAGSTPPAPSRHLVDDLSPESGRLCLEGFGIVSLPEETTLPDNGVAEIGDVAVAIRAAGPEDGVLAEGFGEDGDAGTVALRLLLPEGAFAIPQWDDETEAVVDEVAEGVFDFELPANGAWFWLRVKDAGGDEVYSRWLKAE